MKPSIIFLCLAGSIRNAGMHLIVFNLYSNPDYFAKFVIQKHLFITTSTTSFKIWPQVLNNYNFQID
jgi:hypothetical protein